MSIDDAMSGHIYMKDGSILFLGEPPEVSVHRECIPPVQVIVPIEGELEGRFAEGDDWQEVDGVVVASECYHRYRGKCPEVLSLWLNPTGAEAQAITSDGLLGETHRFLAPHATDEVRRIVRSEKNRADDSELLERIFLRVVEFIAGPMEEAQAVDGRIARAMEVLKTDPLASRRVEELAAEAGVSPRRFRQLFNEHFGTSCKRHMQWSRVLDASCELNTEASLSEIAHRMGFTDASHFTRIYRDLFGVPPSISRGSFDVHVEPETSVAKKPRGSRAGKPESDEPQ